MGEGGIEGCRIETSKEGNRVKGKGEKLGFCYCIHIAIKGGGC